MFELLHVDCTFVCNDSYMEYTLSHYTLFTHSNREIVQETKWVFSSSNEYGRITIYFLFIFFFCRIGTSGSNYLIQKLVYDNQRSLYTPHSPPTTYKLSVFSLVYFSVGIKFVQCIYVIFGGQQKI